MNRFNLLKQAKELFKLKIEQNNFIGLLYPTIQEDKESVFPYNYPALAIYGNIVENNKGWLFSAHIGSIDDSHLGFFYNYTTEEEAKKEMKEFIEWIESMSFKCPDYDEVQKFCKIHRCQPNW